VDDVLVLETAHDVDDQLGLADVMKELIAEALAPARAFCQSGDVDEFDRSVNDLFGSGDFGQRFEPRVGHIDDADVRARGAERIVGALGAARRGERVE
jgi:hypothetical protein